MARASPIQSNFNGGEFSPMLQGRVDADRYRTGLSKCFNSIPTLQGPVLRRSGTRYVADSQVGNGAFDSILIPFKYSNTQSYVVEMSNGLIAFYTQEEQLVHVVGGFTIPYVIASPYSTSDLPNVKWTQSLDTLYLVHPNYPPYVLKRYAATDWTMNPAVFSDGPYLNMGLDPSICQVTSKIHTCQFLCISTVIGPSEITTICGDYSSLALANVANNGSGGIRITFTDADEFADRSQVWIYSVGGTTNANGTFRIKKIDAFNYDIIGATFNAAYTGGAKIAPAPFSDGTVVTAAFGTVSVEYGRMFRLNTAPGTTPWGWGTLIGTTTTGGLLNGSSAGINIIKTFTHAATPTPQFQLGAWSYALGFPTCAGFHDDRLYLGGADGALQRMDGSNSSDYLNFQPTDYTPSAVITDSTAVSFSLISNDANAINSLTSDEYGIPVLSSGGIFVIRPSALNEAITATNVSVKRVDSAGASNVPAIYCGKSTIYLSASKRKLFELTYYYNIDGFRKIDMTEIAENLPGSGITTNIVFQSTPQPIVWCGRSDGTFMAMTFDRNLDALRTGWSTHQLGGVRNSAGEAPLIECFAVIPSSDGTTDEVWVIVQRYINGQKRRCIEYFDKIFEDFNELEDALMVDCGATFDNPKAVTGMTNAANAVVTVTAHGLSTGDKIRFEGIEGFVDSSANPQLINGPQYVVTVLTVNTFSLDTVDSSLFSAFISGGVMRKQVSTISGITWLEGQTVSVLADGAVLTDAVVTSGSIHLSFPAGKVQFGLKYKSQIQMLRLEAGATDGTSMGKIRRINEIAVILNRSSDFKCGPSFDNLDTVVLRDASDDVNQATPLFTGIKDKIGMDMDYDVNNQICFEVDTPTPFMLCAVMPQQVVSDKG